MKFYLLIFCICISPLAFAQKNYVSIEQLAAQKQIDVQLQSLGGYQGNCVQLYITNNTAVDQHILLEAGRRLDNTDPGKQDILVVKEQNILLAAGSSVTVQAYGFCCMASSGAPVAGQKFELGWMETGNLLWIAQLINKYNLPIPTMQSAVWVFSNQHNIASIIASKDASLKDFRREVATHLGIEIPWYDIFYEEDSLQIFSNRHYRLTGEIEYSFAGNGWLNMIVRNSSRQTIYNFTNPAYMGTGSHLCEIDLNIKNWPQGNYSIEVYQDDILRKKTNFSL